MADLSFLEKRALEKLFGMSSGYVLNFSDRTFDDFFADSIGQNISGERYLIRGSSKANRLRSFWEIEPNYLVGKALSYLVKYAETLSSEANNAALIAECKRISERLLQSTAVEHIGEIKPNAPGETFEKLAESVKASIENNQPEAGLDRLHTFTTKYIRTICEKHGIGPIKDKPLHSIFGEYVKFLKKEDALTTKMTETILKSSISVLDAFNEVRNNRSFAHDNDLLNYSESLLIFRNVCAVISFVERLESDLANRNSAAGRSAAFFEHSAPTLFD